MDMRVSHKERRYLLEGAVDVLRDSVFDIYPVFGSDPRFAAAAAAQGKTVAAYLGVEGNPEDYIVDMEVLDDTKQEVLDRAMFALVKQRGNDPVEPGDGIQWEENLLGTVSAPAILQQVTNAVRREGPSVRVLPQTATKNGKPYAVFKVELTAQAR